MYDLKLLSIILFLIMFFNLFSVCTANPNINKTHNIIYIDSTNGNAHSIGISMNYPQKSLRNALILVSNGGTIVIINREFIVPWDKNRDFYALNFPFSDVEIKKSVTICGNSPETTLKSGFWEGGWVAPNCDYFITPGVVVSMKNLTIISKSTSNEFLIDSRGEFYAENCTFEGRVRVAGGGTFKNCTFSSGVIFGGGIWNIAGDLNVINCTFTGKGSNSGVINMENASCTITNCTFTKNKETRGLASDYTTFLSFHCFPDISRGVFSGVVNDGFCTVINSNFADNRCRQGGAIRNNGKGMCNVQNCHFTNNVATGNADNKVSGKGGAILNQGAMVEVLNSTFTDNTAMTVPGVGDGYGGAICNQNQSQSSILNCTFIRNHACYGGAISNIDNSQCQMSYNQLYDNEARHYIVHKAMSSALGSGPNIWINNSVIESEKSLNGKVGISIDDLTESAYMVRNYIEKHHKTPEKIETMGIQLNMAQYLDLLTQELIKIKNSDRTSLEIHDLNVDMKTSNNAHAGEIKYDTYCKIAQDIQGSVQKYKKIPTYTDKSGLGKQLSTYNLVYAYSILFDKIRLEHKLPPSIKLNYLINK